MAILQNVHRIEGNSENREHLTTFGLIFNSYMERAETFCKLFVNCEKIKISGQFVRLFHYLILSYANPRIALFYSDFIFIHSFIGKRNNFKNAQKFVIAYIGYSYRNAKRVF